MFTRLHRWLASRKPQTIRTRSASSRLLVERLEDRLVPAVTITVTTLADGNPASTADEFMSLREALTLMNNRDFLTGLGREFEVGEVTRVNPFAPGTVDIIQFAPGLMGGTITLTAAGGGRLDLQRPMKIVGPAGGVTISGDNQFGIFRVGVGVNQVTLTKMTLTRGNSTQGGAILNEGTLDVTACRFTQNQAGDGGAIVNNGTLTISSSTFDNNASVVMSGSQGRGGAIVNDKSLTVFSSTFVNNTASDDGGAIFTYKQNADTFLFNTVVAHNFKGTRPNDLGTPLKSKGVNGTNNLIGDAATSGGLLDRSTSPPAATSSATAARAPSTSAPSSPSIATDVWWWPITAVLPPPVRRNPAAWSSTTAAPLTPPTTWPINVGCRASRAAPRTSVPWSALSRPGRMSSPRATTS